MGATVSQPMAALEIADRGRLGAADFKRRMRPDGSAASRPAIVLVAPRIREAAAILAGEPSPVWCMRVYVFLDAVPTFGDERVRRVLQRHRIWPLRRVRDLSERQRLLLAVELERVASGGVL